MEFGLTDCQKVSQSFVRKDEIRFHLFFAPACTKQKIHIAPQVWNLFAYSEQIMRAAELLCPLRQQGHLVGKVILTLPTI